MADYIDRQAAIAALREFAEECNGSAEAATAAAMAISVISRMPMPDAPEVGKCGQSRSRGSPGQWQNNGEG